MQDYLPVTEENVRKALKLLKGEDFEKEDDDNPLKCPDNFAYAFSECGFKGEKLQINR
jgi:hypothetical protein